MNVCLLRIYGKRCDNYEQDWLKWQYFNSRVHIWVSKLFQIWIHINIHGLDS